MGVFDSMIGHGGAKTIMRAALRSGDVDVLLEGPPASGKSVALLAIEEHVPGAKYVDAAGLTERGLRDAFKDNPPVILMDELDAAKNDAYEALSMPMEQNRVTKDTANESYDVEVETQVFAACNAGDDLPAHTESRFRTITFEPYSYDEYEEVCAVLLPDEVDWVQAEDTARQVAKSVYDAIDSRDPRDARDAAKLAGHPERIEKIAKALSDPKADVDSDPLDPEEIKRAQTHRGTGGFGGGATQSSDGDEPRQMPPEQYREEACDHLLENGNPDRMRMMGRFLCPDCASRFDVDVTTPLSEARAETATDGGDGCADGACSVEFQ